MANLEKLGRILSLQMNKLELELACPSCSITLQQPTLLPCTHIVCRQCIMATSARNEHQYECPVCRTTLLLRDIKPFMQMENMVCIFRSLDNAMAYGGLMSKLPSRRSSLSGNCSPPLELKEEVACNTFDGLRNSVQPNPPQSGVTNRSIHINGGGSGEIANSGSNRGAHSAGKDFCLNLEEPSTPPSIHCAKNPETKDDQNSGNRLPAEKAKVLLSYSDFLADEAQNLGESDDAKTSRPAAPYVMDEDEVREARRHKLNNEHGSDSSNKPCADHAYTEGVVNCAFCQLFEITEITGPMLHYDANGKPAGAEVSPLMVKHFHQKCFEWSPLAYFDKDMAMNLKDELARASKIKCCSCELKGAALGCCVKSCWRSYHMPCAFKLPGCRWDYDHFNLLCPYHSSCKFRHEIIQLKWAVKAKRSSMLRAKSRARRIAKTSWSSALIPKFSIPGKLTSITEGHGDESWTAEPGVCSKWVLCGSDLSEEGMGLLKKFASLTNTAVTSTWKQNVTHVIASTDKHGACNRSQKVLMAILNGKWVLTLEWVKASMEAKSPVCEEAYEISLDCFGICGGPRKGRIRAAQKAPKIFSGLRFYFSDQFDPSYRGFLEELIVVAGGIVLKNVGFLVNAVNAKVSSNSSYIVYCEDPPETCNPKDDEEVGTKRVAEIVGLVNKTGFKVIGHILLLDVIASYGSAADLDKGVVGRNR